MDLSFESLAGQVGGTFRFGTDREPVDLVLSSATSDEHGGGSLIFGGPASPRLGQGTYELTGPDDLAGPLFIVPVGGDDSATTYQAVFA